MFGKGHGPGGGGGRYGRRGGRGGVKGPISQCICPKCGHIQPHTPGKPCYLSLCAKCGSPMVGRLDISDVAEDDT